MENGRNPQDTVRQRVPQDEQSGTEERFRQLIEDTDSIVWEADFVLDADLQQSPLRFTFVSHQPASLLGYTSDQWLTEPGVWFPNLHPEDCDRIISLYREVFMEGCDSTAEYRLIAADKRVVWVRDRVRVIRDSSGKPRRLRGVMMNMTERIETQQALRESEERYSAFIQQSSDGIWCFEGAQPIPVRLPEDDQINTIYKYGVLSECNAAFARMYGLSSPAEIIGARLSDLMPQSDPHNIEYLRTFIRSGYCLNDAESHEVDKNGKPKYFMNNLVGIVENGILYRAWGTQRDITERKTAEIELKRQTAFFLELFESSPNGILILDREDRILRANQGFCRMFQYASEEIRGKYINDLIVPEHLAEEGSDLTRRIYLGEILRKESVRKRKDGSLVSVSILGYPIRIEGTMEAGYAIYSDITDRVRANDAIREMAQGVAAGTGEAFFLTLIQQLAKALRVDVAYFGTTIKDAPRKIVIHAACCDGTIIENFEYDLQGTPCDTVFGQEIKYYPDGVRHQFPGCAILEQLHVDCYMGIPLFGLNGGPLGVLAILHRSTLPNEQLARSMLNIFAARIAAELERRRSEEALHRSEEQFRQSQKMEAVGRLAGGIAHDFNNLLTAITGYSDLMLIRIPENDPMRRHAEEIRRAGERAAALTRQLLAFSRKQILQPKTIDLNAIVTDTEKMLRRLIGEDIELSTCLQPGLDCVRADPNQIEQVIMNLAVNARDAMPEGGMLTIRTDRVRADDAPLCDITEMPPGTYVMLSISDTGTGIDPEIRSHLFEPFFTTKEKGKGTGLGLSTVYGIVKQSNGHICMTSELGHGSTFRICLPAVAGTAESLRSAVQRNTETRGIETILLVEDEDIVRRMAVEILRENGYRVLEAANGNEAIRLNELHPGTIHMLLTDVIMPGMNGQELAKRLTVDRPEMRVLYMSGHTGDAIISHGTLKAGSAFLQKPFLSDILTRAVRDLLDNMAI